MIFSTALSFTRRTLFAATRTILLGSLVLPLVVVPNYPSASCPEILEWHEVNTQSFTVLYSNFSEELGQQIANQYGSLLDREFHRIQSLFNFSLPFNLTIRLYPTEEIYYCLNALPPELVAGDKHANLGSFEIALLEPNLFAQETFEDDLLNAIRYETAVLFLLHLTDRDVPPGLTIAVGSYAQDPAYTIPEVSTLESMAENDPPSWSNLWENPLVESDETLRLQATSTVAYLADVYGWLPFLEFLKSLPTSADFRQALFDHFGTEFPALEEHWREYYPYYLEGRWRANVIYNYDLSTFENLIEGGAYTDAASGLKNAIEFLDQTENTSARARAETLLAEAQTGIEAGALAIQARHALQDGEYLQTIELAQEAIAFFEQIEARDRISEVSTYQERAEEILVLRDELSRLLEEAADVPPADTTRIKEVSIRLAELGDEESFERTSTFLEQRYMEELDNAALAELEARKRTMYLTLGGLILGLMLLVHWIRLWRRPPTPEARLHY